MCTTDGDTERNSSIVDFSSSARSPRGVTARGSRDGGSGCALERSSTLHTSRPATASSSSDSRM